MSSKGEKISISLKEQYATGRRVSPFWRTWFPFSTSLWIRDYLISIYPNDDYIWNMWKKYSNDLYEYRLKTRPELEFFKPGTYQNFCNYFYWLRRIGLIEMTRTEPVEREWLTGKFVDRHYYRIVIENKDHPGWINPRKYLYRESWEKHH